MIERTINMAKTSPWHSILAKVHHNNTSCNTGNNIERENRRAGKGGKPLCQLLRHGERLKSLRALAVKSNSWLKVRMPRGMSHRPLN